MSVWPKGCPVSVTLIAFPRGEYLGKDGIERGVRVMF